MSSLKMNAIQMNPYNTIQNDLNKKVHNVEDLKDSLQNTFPF